MLTWLEELSDDITREFHVGVRENMEVKSKIDKGFSKAEVYFVELKGWSELKGYYFLKIDSEADEYENNQNDFCFSRVAKCIRKCKIKGYYVMLVQIAGMSKAEYDSFYSISSSSTKINAVKKMVGEILEEATKNRNVVGTELMPTELFRKQLRNKVNANGVMADFLSKHIGEASLSDIVSVEVDNMTLPNAFAYAVNDTLWNSIRINNMACCIHGDFHGNNVFVSGNTSDYVMIDMALYREDGWLFYDMAYFEYSLMFHNMGNESLADWLYCVNRVAEQAWGDIDFKDSGVVRAIVEEENSWIDKKVAEGLNYLDQLRNARLMARILVGLNYTGKKGMTDEARSKSYMYACCYLKRLLELMKLRLGSHQVWCWRSTLQHHMDEDECNRFLEFAGRFNNSQNYYLILGREWGYPDAVSLNLGKIRLSGIISFCLQKGFSEILQRRQLLKYIIPNNENTWNDIEKESTWWLYANGIAADPESQAERFSIWKNKYRKFWNQFPDRINKSIGEDDLLFIIDGKKFQKGDDKYIQYLLSQLDAIESVTVNIAILDSENILHDVDAQDYVNLQIKSFQIGMGEVAEFCNLYLPEIVDDTVYIPHRLNRIGIQLEKEDQKYIEQYTVLVHEQLIRGENILEESEKYKFFFGEPITWTAIEEELYVKHKKIKLYEKIVREKIEKPSKDQILISIQHSPGAGATILGRIICWNLKKEYPTFVLNGKFDDDIYESLMRVAAISGKYLLVFLDGDYNQNDVNQFLWRMSGMRIKVCVLYSCRVYNTKFGDDLAISILEARDGNLFRDEYEKVMRRWKNYDEEECQRRIQNMNNLTTENNLIDFRIPFFYGMHAFEDDYQGIHEYLSAVAEFMGKSRDLEKVILYIALISYYTENKGLGFKYARKLLNRSGRSGRELLVELQDNFPNIIYIVDSSYRICHPIVARNILQLRFPQFQSEEYKKFVTNFICDMGRCESVESVSDRYSELLMDIFVKRDTEDEINGDNTQKKSFSQIILDIGNSNLQEQIFEILVKVLPKNPYFHQHYGRLINANDPTRLEEAEKQMKEAIDIDPENGTLFHSRGNLYVQYVMHQMNNSYKNMSSSELYNKLRYYVDLAIADFESSIKLGEKGNYVSDLVYPYSSIVKISTTFVHQLAKRSGFAGNEKKFLEQNSEISKWSKKLVSEAMLYDIDTELRYGSIRSNNFYNNTRNHLLRYKWTSEELEVKIKENPDDYAYQIAYLGMFASEKSAWKQKSQQQLRQVIIYGENLLKLNQYGTEGVLWKWFNACIHLRQSIDETYGKMLGLLETLPDRDLNSTANYFRSILYFCKYVRTRDEKMIDSMYECLNICKNLARDRKNQITTHYYYTGESIAGKNTLPLGFDRENAYRFDGTVISADSNQSGYLTLDINPRLRAFFVPIHTELKRYQEIGQTVKAKIGFRFDGLSAWELEQKI